MWTLKRSLPLDLPAMVILFSHLEISFGPMLRTFCLYLFMISRSTVIQSDFLLLEGTIDTIQIDPALHQGLDQMGSRGPYKCSYPVGH